MSSTPVLEVDNLTVAYAGHDRKVVAVNGVSFEVRAGDRIGIVGESGSGKSTLAFALMRLLRHPGKITAGAVRLDGVDLVALREDEIQAYRGARVSMIYQDPFTYLNPVLRVGYQIEEVIRAHGRISKSAARERVVQLLEHLDLPHPETLVDAYPHQLSGGQRQRIVIGMGIALRPRILIADEPTTALDVTVQAQILRLLKRVVTEIDAALLLITHDINVVRAVCDRVLVMYGGHLVEAGTADAVLRQPKHPYAVALLRSSRRISDARRQLVSIEGSPPDLAEPPPGCPFEPRCPDALPECRTMPTRATIAPGHEVACWLHRGPTA